MPFWGAQPQGTGSESWVCIAGSLEGRSETRAKQGLGTAGDMPAPPAWGWHRAAPTPVPNASSPLPALSLLDPQLWRSLSPGAGTHPSVGISRHRAPALPSPQHWQGQGSVQQLKHVPTVTDPELVVAGHPGGLTGTWVLWHSVSSLWPSQLSVYFVWIDMFCGWSLSCRVY